MAYLSPKCRLTCLVMFSIPTKTILQKSHLNLPSPGPTAWKWCWLRELAGLSSFAWPPWDWELQESTPIVITVARSSPVNIELVHQLFVFHVGLVDWGPKASEIFICLQGQALVKTTHKNNYGSKNLSPAGLRLLLPNLKGAHFSLLRLNTTPLAEMLRISIFNPQKINSHIQISPFV